MHINALALSHAISGSAPGGALPSIPLSFSLAVCLATALEQGPLYPTLRANPFPKVTDLFCRLPLPTLYY